MVATQCMQAVIGAIKQTPEIEVQDVEAIVGSFYPGEGDWRLELYAQAMYDVASITEPSFVALRSKILELSIEDLGRIMPQVRLVADELLKPYAEQMRLQQRKAQLEGILSGPSPIKTEPDQETLDFWNSIGPGVMEWDCMLMELEDINRQMEG